VRRTTFKSDPQCPGQIIETGKSARQKRDYDRSSDEVDQADWGKTEP
jgi:hypothetical protein